MKKNCFVCRFDVIEGKCEKIKSEWHKTAMQEMYEKINKIKAQNADQSLQQLLF